MSFLSTIKSRPISLITSQQTQFSLFARQATESKSYFQIQTINKNDNYGKVNIILGLPRKFSKQNNNKQI